MINLWIVIAILFLHFIFDFIVQTDEQALGKSKNWTDLLLHTFTYCWLWYLPIILGGCYKLWSFWMMLFPVITFVCHTIQDYITSREVVKLHESGKRHTMFVIIGLDQFLHYIQLFLTFYFLNRL